MASQYSELHSLPYYGRKLNVVILDALFLRAMGREDRIIHEEKLPHFIDEFRMQYMDHLWTTRPIDCIKGQHLYKLIKIPMYYKLYLSWRSIKPKHLPCTDFEARVKDSIHNLPNIVLSDKMRFDHQAWTIIKVSWTLKSWFAWKKEVNFFCSNSCWFTTNYNSICFLWCKFWPYWVCEISYFIYGILCKYLNSKD